MRRAARGLALAAALGLAGCAAARPVAAPSLAGMPSVGALGMLRSGGPPGCGANGAALHLGQGRFVTAAHLVDGSVQRLRGACPPGPPAIALRLGPAEVPAGLLRAGRDRVDAGVGQRYLAGEDLALLVALRPLPAPPPAILLCEGPPPPGTPVLLATPLRASYSRLLGLVAEPDPAFGAYLEIPEPLQPGESGGAVFALESGCLAGLVSHREEGAVPPRARLVPAAVIRRFLGG